MTYHFLFFKKMFFVKTWYKTHDLKLLAIFKVFKTCRYYLKGFKFKVFIFINYSILTNYNIFCKLSF